MSEPTPESADLWARRDAHIEAMIARAIDEHLQSHHAHVPDPPPGPDLDPDALQAFRRHLASTGGRETCLICDVDRWQARWFVGRRTYITKTCVRCGFVAAFDAAVIGVLPPEPEQPPTSDLTIRFCVDGRAVESTVNNLNGRIEMLLDSLAQGGVIS